MIVIFVAVMYIKYKFSIIIGIYIRHAKTRIRSYDRSVRLGVNVGVYQGSVLSPLLFIIVMEAVTHSVREGLPWEMLYADDLVLVGKCEEELKEKLRKWNECLKDKGLKIYGRENQSDV